jgi:thymidylate kinase
MGIVENRTGKFLVFEGTDGSGKRTQVDRMANRGGNART